MRVKISNSKILELIFPIEMKIQIQKISNLENFQKFYFGKLDIFQIAIID